MNVWNARGIHDRLPCLEAGLLSAKAVGRGAFRNLERLTPF
jgi:hypothetical protein